MGARSPLVDGPHIGNYQYEFIRNVMKKLFTPAKVALHVMTILAMVLYPGGFALVRNTVDADVGDITITSLTDLGGGSFKLNGTWIPTGNQCWTPGGGGTFHYRIQVTDNGTPVSPDPMVSPAGCNEDYTSDVDNDNRGLGGNWPAIAHANNGNVAQPDATFSLDPGTHTICANLIHTNDAGQDRVQASTCWDQDIIVPGPAGSLELTKVIDTGAASPDDFSFTISPDPNGVGSVQTTSGVYTFNNLPAGTYTVAEASYDGYEQISTTCENVSVGEGQTATCEIHNAQLQQEVAIVSGVKYHDLNQNGQRDDGEPLLNGWEICQTTEGAPDLAVTSASFASPEGIIVPECVLTGDGDWPDGYYEFVHYGPAIATITETLQDGWEQTAPAEGSHVVFVEAPILYEENDFGNFQIPPPAGDVTFEKVILGDGNSADWTFTVWDGDTEIGTYASGVTAPIPTGFYSVTENGPDGYNFVSADGICTEDGQIYMNVDEQGGTCTFTNQEIAGSLSGQKFNDLDEQGDKDAGEPGLPDWTIQLWTSCTLESVDLNADGAVNLSDAVLFTGPYLADLHKPAMASSMANVNHDVMVTGLDKECMGLFLNGLPDVVGGNVLVAETVTDANGNYLFDNLNPGSYWVSEVQQNGWTQSYPASETYGPIELGLGDDLTGYDFGNHQTPAPQPQPEPGTPTLTITKDVDKTSVVAGTNVTYTVTITNTGTGTATNVKLSDLLPGSFFVTLTGAVDLSQSLGDLDPGKAVTTTYTVTVPGDTTAGDYVNTATASADNHGNVSDTATVAVQRIPQVLGVQEGPQETKLIDTGIIIDDTPTGQVLGAEDTLAETGAGIAEYALFLFGALMLALGVFGIRTFNTRKIT